MSLIDYMKVKWDLGKKPAADANPDEYAMLDGKGLSKYSREEIAKALLSRLSTKQRAPDKGIEELLRMLRKGKGKLPEGEGGGGGSFEKRV